MNIKFLVKFARQSLLLASGKVMCFSKYTGTGIKNHLPKLGSKRWKLPLCDCVRTLDLSQFLFYLRGHHCLLGLSGFVWVSQTTGKLDLLQFLFYLRGHSCLLGLSWLAFILKVWVHELAWCDWVVLFEKTLHYHCVCLANGLHPPSLLVLHSHPPVCIQ